MRFKHLLRLYLDDKATHQQRCEFLEMVGSGLCDKAIEESLERDIEFEMVAWKSDSQVKSEDDLVYVIKNSTDSNPRDPDWSFLLSKSFHFFRRERNGESISISNMKPHRLPSIRTFNK